MKNLKIISGVLSGSKKILFNSHDGLKTVDIDKILFCKADGNYTKVFSEGDIKSEICKSLCEFEKHLVSHDFVRCHYSLLVNLKRIDSFRRKKMKIFIAVAGYKLPVSKRNCQEILGILLDIGIKETKNDDQLINILTS